MNDKEYCIYVIKNSINDKMYVGRTCNAEGRWRQHRSPCTHKRCPEQPLYIDMDTYGRDNFWYEIIESGLTYDEAKDKEIYWTNKLDTQNTGYNINCGDIISEETRRKMVENRDYVFDERHPWWGKSFSGENNAMYGQHHTEESKKKMSDSVKKYYETHENAWKGQHHTEEAKKKMSEKKMGKCGANHNKSIPTLDLDTGIVYCSATEAGRQLGIDPRYVSAVCRGEHESAHGHRFKYVDKSEVVL